MTGFAFPAWDVVQRKAARHALAAVVQRALKPVPRGSAVLVAASGGADSTALAVVCAGVARRGGWRVALATVDHGLRTESGTDAAFVQALGAWMDLPVHHARVELARGAALAARAREARYRALAEALRKAGAVALLTAHHAQDQLETVLMRLVRGAGAAAAGGMPARRSLPEGGVLLRPVLERSREELRGLLQDCGVPWREDPSNADRARVRGRLRHEVLPVLESLRPGAAVRAARSARRVRGAAAALARRSALLLQGDGPWSRNQLRKAGSEALALALRGAEPGAKESTLERMVQAVRDDRRTPRRFRLGRFEWTVRAGDVVRTAVGAAGGARSRGSLAVDQ